jgi:hypothetical protein
VYRVFRPARPRLSVAPRNPMNKDETPQP